MKDVDRNDLLSLTEASDLERLGEDGGVESEPKVLVKTHQFLQGKNPRKLTWKTQEIAGFFVAFFRFHVSFPGWPVGCVDLGVGEGWWWNRGRLASFEVPIEMRCGRRWVGEGKAGDMVDGSFEIRQTHQLRLVVEIPLFTRVLHISSGAWFLESTVFLNIFEGNWKVDQFQKKFSCFFLGEGKIIQRGMWNLYGLVWSWASDEGEWDHWSIYPEGFLFDWQAVCWSCPLFLLVRICS